MVAGAGTGAGGATRATFELSASCSGGDSAFRFVDVVFGALVVVEALVVSATSAGAAAAATGVVVVVVVVVADVVDSGSGWTFGAVAVVEAAATASSAVEVTLLALDCLLAGSVLSSDSLGDASVWLEGSEALAVLSTLLLCESDVSAFDAASDSVLLVSSEVGAVLLPSATGDEVFALFLFGAVDVSSLFGAVAVAERGTVAPVSPALSLSLSYNSFVAATWLSPSICDCRTSGSCSSAALAYNRKQSLSMTESTKPTDEFKNQTAVNTPDVQLVRLPTREGLRSFAHLAPLLNFVNFEAPTQPNNTYMHITRCFHFAARALGAST